MSSAAFSNALSRTLKFEGGYVNDPNDPGGETNFGISKRSYPHLDIKNLTLEEATKIYERDFWHRAGCARLPDAVAVAHFDAAVNHGIAGAIKILQRALRVMDDGKLGPKTLAAVASNEVMELVDDMLWARLRYYFNISSDKKAIFLRGWLLRTIQLREFIWSRYG
jgi:lysozyme family protein